MSVVSKLADLSWNAHFGNVNESTYLWHLRNSSLLSKNSGMSYSKKQTK